MDYYCGAYLSFVFITPIPTISPIQFAPPGELTASVANLEGRGDQCRRAGESAEAHVGGGHSAGVVVR